MSALLSHSRTEEWLQTQAKTFQHWANAMLIKRMIKVDNLFEDFKDGVVLVNLVELISGKPLGKWHKKPNMELLMLQNIDTALSFLEKEIRLVNISARDIYEGNRTAILGLLWTVILRYQIAKPGTAGDSSESPRQALLRWLARMAGDDFRNGFHSFQNGVILTKLLNRVHQLSTGKPLVDIATLDRGKGLENNERAMRQADELFGIHQVVPPELLCDEKPEERSVMLYLSLWNSVERSLTIDKLKRCRVSGPGVSAKNVAGGAPLRITIQSDVTDREENWDVVATGPRGATSRMVRGVVAYAGDGRYEAEYTPPEPGHYSVDVSVDGDSLPGCPYEVTIAGDPLFSPGRARAGTLSSLPNAPGEWSAAAAAPFASPRTLRHATSLPSLLPQPLPLRPDDPALRGTPLKPRDLLDEFRDAATPDRPAPGRAAPVLPVAPLFSAPPAAAPRDAPAATEAPLGSALPSDVEHELALPAVLRASDDSTEGQAPPQTSAGAVNRSRSGRDTPAPEERRSPRASPEERRSPRSSPRKNQAAAVADSLASDPPRSPTIAPRARRESAEVAARSPVTSNALERNPTNGASDRRSSESVTASTPPTRSIGGLPLARLTSASAQATPAGTPRSPTRARVPSDETRGSNIVRPEATKRDSPRPSLHSPTTPRKDRPDTFVPIEPGIGSLQAPERAWRTDEERLSATTPLLAGASNTDGIRSSREKWMLCIAITLVVLGVLMVVGGAVAGVELRDS